MSILKVDVSAVLLFFLFFYSFVPKIEICLETLFGQKSPKKAIAGQQRQHQRLNKPLLLLRPALLAIA